MEEKLVLPTVNFTRFGKVVSPTVIFWGKNIHPNDSRLYKLGKLVSLTVNLTCFGKLVSVTVIPISLAPKKTRLSRRILGK